MPKDNDRSTAEKPDKFLINGLREMLEGLFNEKLNPIYARLDLVDTRLSAIDTRLNAIDTRLVAVEKELKRHGRAIKKLGRTLDVAIRTFDYGDVMLHRRVSKIEERLGLAKT